MSDQARSDGLRLLDVMNETRARGRGNVPVTPAIAARPGSKKGPTATTKPHGSCGTRARWGGRSVHGPRG